MTEWKCENCGEKVETEEMIEIANRRLVSHEEVSAEELEETADDIITYFKSRE